MNLYPVFNRTFLTLSTFVLFLLTTNSVDGKTAQQETSEAQLNPTELLKIALDDLSNRHSHLDYLHTVAYDKRVSDSEGNNTHLRFDPTKPSDIRTSVISTTGKSLAEVTLPTPLVITPKIITKLNLRYVKEEPEHWVFQGDMDIYPSDSEKATEDKDDDANFDEFLVAFVRISKTTGQFSRLTFKNLDSFEPSALATIESFEIDARFESWEVNGPLVAATTELKISGSYGFLYTFEESMQQQLSLYSDTSE